MEIYMSYVIKIIIKDATIKNAMSLENWNENYYKREYH